MVRGIFENDFYKRKNVFYIKEYSKLLFLLYYNKIYFVYFLVYWRAVSKYILCYSKYILCYSN